MLQQGTNANQTLSQAVQQILDDHPDGFTERAVRRAVIEEAGLRCTSREVRDTLRSHPDLFVPLAGGVWRSRAAVEAEPQAGTGSFRLEELARSLGVGEGLTGGRLVERWAREHGVGAFSWTGFHNAVVDVLVLVEAIRCRMAENPPLASEFALETLRVSENP